MSIRELLETVTPPQTPLEVGSPEAWKHRESTIGIIFPKDLYDLCHFYGSGWFMGIRIYNPFSPAYQDYIEQDLKLFRDIKQSEGNSAIPYDIFPDIPGLLPCGDEENGGHIFWLVDDNNHPTTWKLVLFGSVFTWENLNIPITTFLSKSFRKEMQCIWWDLEWQKEEFSNVWFRPESMSPGNYDS